MDVREAVTAGRGSSPVRRGAAVLVALLAIAAGCQSSEDTGNTALPSATAGPIAPGSTTPGSPPGSTPVGSEAEVSPPDRHLDLVGRDRSFPRLGSPLIDVAHYDLDLELGEAGAPEDLRASATLTVRARQELGARQHPAFELDLARFDVESVTIDGADASWEERAPKLAITPGRAITKGATFRLQIRYRGRPDGVPTGALGGTPVGWQDGLEGSLVLSEPEGAHGWFPANDTVLDKATYTITITVPDPLTAVASGRLDRVEDTEGGQRSRWVMDKPMASYLATVVTGELAERDGGNVDGVDYDYWHPADEPLAPSLLRTPEAVQALTERLGRFPFSTYGAIEYPSSFVPARPVSQLINRVAFEAQGRSLFATGSAGRTTVVHEAAHQWLGDSVSVTDWSGDLWWVEGFAQFAETAVLDEDSLARPTAFARERAECVGIDADDIAEAELFSEASYSCGAVVFHALHRRVGSETFWRIVRTFAERHAYSNASTDDLIAVASDVTGTDQRSFFELWLSGERPDRP